MHCHYKNTVQTWKQFECVWWLLHQRYALWDWILSSQHTQKKLEIMRMCKLFYFIYFTDNQPENLSTVCWCLPSGLRLLSLSIIWRFRDTRKITECDKYTLLHKLACNNRDMQANECNKMFIIHTRAASCLFPHKVSSNSPCECIDSN